MNMVSSRLLRRLLLVAFLLGITSHVRGVQVLRNSSATLYIDLGNQLECNYACYQITNNDGATYSNLWVTIGNFSGATAVKLGAGEPGQYNVGNLQPNEVKTVYFYLDGTNTTSSSSTHTVSVYRGYPGASGVLLTNSSFTVSGVSSTANNSANKISAVSYSPSVPVLGGMFSVSLDGQVGVLKAGDPMIFLPASSTNWNAAAFQLIGSSIWLTNGATTYSYSNNLSFNSPVALNGNGAGGYHAQFWYRAVAVTSSSTPISPNGCFATGNNSSLEHSSVTASSVPPILPPTNTTVLANSASVSQLYTNETVTWTLRFTNSGATDMTLDRVTDTLPAGFAYVANSSSFNGAAILNPTISGTTLTWSESYAVPAGASRSLLFQATPTNAFGSAANSASGFAGSSQIDTTLATSDNAPATATVRVLWSPSASPDSGTLLEDGTLSVAAPGVLANDTEPNGFGLSVLSSTQPSHGSVTIHADGSYTYSPNANYNGSDSFTYTLTNDNARSATATVSLTITAVNDPPTLNPIGNLTLTEPAGQQTVPLSGLSAGPANENAQALTVSYSSSNPTLIPSATLNYSSPNSTGTLTFTPAANVVGSSTLTVVVKDDGGVANGGVDSVTNTFTVTVLGVTNTWASGSSFTGLVSNATGPAGVGYSQSNLTGVLEVPATSASPFTFRLRSWNGSSAGPAANFDATHSYTWPMLTTTRGITGFAPDKVLLDSSEFANDLAGGTFSLSSDGSALSVNFSANHAPTASPASYGRPQGTFLRIPLSGLLATYTSDADGDARALVQLGASTNGSYIATNGGYILFAPTNNLPESFSYVVQDQRSYRPGDTVLCATNWVTVSVTNAIGVARSITAVNGTIQVQFASLPGSTLDVERATAPEGPWTLLYTTNVPAGGVWTVEDLNPPNPSAFYRVKQH